MGRCLHCAADLAEDSRFCSSCGQPASSASVVPTLTLDPEPGPGANDFSPATPKGDGAGISAPLNLAPGAVLLGRYRILNILGRGGMGLVYRADDLKLGQAVALKFLPPSLARDPENLTRFLAEVRTARQVSHPNVCRVYDIAEAEGHYFLSMEYVDGEDLGTLLARIGRLPPAKALEIAHQLCAGLAAAHARQVVHRDLKPSNIMIDGRGHARITDFGLAIAPEDAKPGELAGTPSYMAPELFEGKPATAQSDLYALGIVLYELYTGKHPWDRRPASESQRRQSTRPPSSPSHHAPEIDPAVDRIILRCLEKDPSARPSSALQVGAALPGGSPLAMAIAAGETPSPEMVAAAGEEGALAPAKAWALAAGAIVILGFLMFLAQRSLLVNLVRMKDPALLIERAQQLDASLGYTAAADRAFWYRVDKGYYEYSAKIPAPERYRTLAQASRSPFEFWYRQSPQTLEPTQEPWDVTAKDPPQFYSGDAALGMDSVGRLLYFAGVGPQKEALGAAASTPDWQPLFAAAGLDFAQSRPLAAAWLPDVPADQNFSWEVTSGGQSAQIAGATYHGRIVFFQVFAPWTQAERMQPLLARLASRVSFVVFVVFALGIFAVCLMFARHNLKQGRGDLRGTTRASVSLALALFVGYLLSAHYGASALWFWDFVNASLGDAVITAVQFAAFYLALEPYVRRTWPEMLISWNRLLAGSWQNPLVGRDILIGLLIGITATATQFARIALPYWFPISSISPAGGLESALATSPRFLGHVCFQATALMNAMGTLAFLFLVARLTRRKGLAIVLTGVLVVASNLTGENLLTELPVATLYAVMMLYALLRFGLLASAVSWVAGQLCVAPFTTDFSRWYAWRGLFIVGLLMAVTIYAFKISLAGKSAFGTVFEE